MLISNEYKEQLSISIQSKNNDDNLNINTAIIQENTQNDIAIGQYVRNNLNIIKSFCESNNEELTNLLSSEYTHKTFGISTYSFMKEVEENAPKQDKYWKNPKLKINNKYYVVTSEWFERNRQQFNNYLSKVA